MTQREGNERAAAERLTSGIHPESARLVLERCLTGDLSASHALRELYEMTAQPELVRGMVDQVTNRAAARTRAGDRLLQDRVDELTQLVLDDELLAPSIGASAISAPRPVPPHREEQREGAEDPVARHQ